MAKPRVRVVLLPNSYENICFRQEENMRASSEKDPYFILYNKHHRFEGFEMRGFFFLPNLRKVDIFLDLFCLTLHVQSLGKSFFTT